MIKDMLEKECQEAVDNFSLEFAEKVEPIMVEQARKGVRAARFNVNQEGSLKESVSIIKSEKFAENINDLLGLTIRIEEVCCNTALGEALGSKGWKETTLIVEF